METVVLQPTFQPLSARRRREAAVYSGIRVDRTKIVVFMISGVMGAISGILLSSRLSTAQTNSGMAYELDAIAAVVLGGTSRATVQFSGSMAA